jgi:hypothetical protein
MLARLLAGFDIGQPAFGVSPGAPEEIRTPDPQIRSLVLADDTATLAPATRGSILA